MAEDGEEAAEAGPSTGTRARGRTQQQKRQQQQAAIEKIKKSKAFKKRKRFQGDGDDSDDLANAILDEKVPLPGQTDNCEICKKRFTVTAYTKAGPQGGLLCPKCAKEHAADDDKPKKGKKRATATPGSRRNFQSRLLDGQIGAKSLVTICIEVLTKNIDLADDLGDLPDDAKDRIARMLSKKRLVNPLTLNLFLRPNVEHLNIYDGARLSQDDYIRIFQTAHKLKKLKVRNAIQFKNEVMEYLTGRNIKLESIYLHGANLISDDCWKAYLTAKGKCLKALQVYYTDRYFGNEVLASLKNTCPSLTRLKICHNQQIDEEGLEHLTSLQGLEHLSLHLINDVGNAYIPAIESSGRQLRTLSLRNVLEADDDLLNAIHDNCKSLTKLRIQESEAMTDAGFVKLFTDWENKPLTSIDLEKCRYVNATDPKDNQDGIGLCSQGFKALMKHSGEKLKFLNVHACRHISREAFEEVFDLDMVYPELLKLEISFCPQVTDLIIGRIFRTCPQLKELNIFGCMSVKDVVVPRGKILIGLPNAMDMVIEGEGD